MTAFLAILISGVLLDRADMPLPNCPFSLINADSGQVIKVETDKDGKFQVDLAPGVYRHELETIRVNKSMPKLKLHRRAPTIETKAQN